MWVDVAILVLILIVIIVFSAQFGKLRWEIEQLKKERGERLAGEEKRLLRLYQSLEETLEVFERYAEKTNDELKRERESLRELSGQLKERQLVLSQTEIRRNQSEGPWGAPVKDEKTADTRADRTQQVLQLLSEGKSVGETARILGLSKTEVGLIAGMRKK